MTDPVSDVHLHLHHMLRHGNTRGVGLYIVLSDAEHNLRVLQEISAREKERWSSLRVKLQLSTSVATMAVDTDR